MRVIDVRVPLYLVVGENAPFQCHFDMEGEQLYSLKWWKDEHQFFQYIPRNEPKMVVFQVAGVHVDVSICYIFYFHNVSEAWTSDHWCNRLRH